MKARTWYFTVAIIASAVTFIFVQKLYPSQLSDNILFSLFLGAGIGIFVFPIREIKRRIDNGIDVFATLETDPEKIQEHMLFIMQHHGIEENLKELNDIFRNYPQWDLSNWEVFRAWYKAQIDHMIDRPEIYGLTLKGGLPYNKDDDPLYDPDAPDWEQFDRPCYYDDKDDEADEDYSDNDDKNSLRKAVGDDFRMGIGLGATESILNK